MNKDSVIYVAGHTGLIGSALVRNLKGQGFINIVTADSNEYNLVYQTEAESLLALERPEYVFMAAGKSGGLGIQKDAPSAFIYENLMIHLNLLHACSVTDSVKKVLFIGTANAYPKDARVPITESKLYTGPLANLTRPWGVATLAALEACKAFNQESTVKFITCLAPYVYGYREPNENDTYISMIPSMLQVLIDAKKRNLSRVEFIGSGKPHREFVHADDMADACVFLMENYEKPEPINVGSGQYVEIEYLACMMRKMVGYTGTLSFTGKSPDDSHQILLDSSKMQNMGWTAKIPLHIGVDQIYTELF